MKCVLHVGPPKTGTTSIQTFLQRNRRALSQDGILVPYTKEAAQKEFNILAMSKPNKNRAELRWGIRTGEDLALQQDSIKARLGNMFRGLDEHHTAVISIEGLSTRNRSEIGRLREILSQYFDTFRVVYFLRRQDLLSVSQFKNRIKLRGLSGTNPFDEPRSSNADRLDRWASVFGDAAVSPEIFPDSRYEPADLMDLFFAAAGIDNLRMANYVQPGRRNQNWDVRAIELMQLINRQLPAVENGVVPEERQIIEKVLTEGWPNFVGYRPARAEAQAYYALPVHTKDNERVRARWFPNQPTLFNDDFSMYPESVTSRLTVEDCAYAIVQVAKARVGSTAKVTTPNPRDRKAAPAAAELAGKETAARGRRAGREARRAAGKRAEA